ncbi:aldehyde dehydrogenase family protein [Pseudomonas syringae]|nr:aldehyde dehydrogenase family protein [Pseudomonas syringae]MCF5069534.1 aldehyde dehydrogenase family protein [Pseudomonas syringae]
MYLINGQLRQDCNLETALDLLQRDLPRRLAQPLASAVVIAAAENFAGRLRERTLNPPVDEEQRRALIDFCRPENLREKLERELGINAHSLRRIDYRQSRFENWSPLGLVVHITPGNSPLLAFCAVLEGLLAGNVNWLRPSSSDAGLSAQLLGDLAQCDTTARLAGYIAVLPATTAQIGLLCQRANGVSAWGGESALRAINRQIPPGCRWIDWGHRISFAYLTADAASAEALDAVVDEVCRLDQQACSSPQWLLVDSDDPLVLRSIGEDLAAAFERRARKWPALAPTLQEACEITTQTQLARLTQSFSGQPGHVWSGPGWRVIWAHDQSLAPSPLFRTLRMAPVPRAQITPALLQWRNVLQSCGLICTAGQTAALARALIAAGVTRVAPIQAMHDGYEGEPHDGVYALQRLSRRISVSLPPQQLPTHATLDPQPSPAALTRLPIMDKATFTRQPPGPAAQLYFRSGGSSATPTLSTFSYRDFQKQMAAAADGLFAAGLDPARDKVMNLFFSGGLYGGFYSFAKVLEQLGATHLPMGAPADDDYREIAQLIVDLGVTVLIGMPSTLHRLFLNEEQRLKDYGGVRKVFLGGEHPGEQSRQLLQRCGVTTIRSAIYGSVDAGPLGHACSGSADGVFHLMSDIQHLEIVDFDRDTPVIGTETGRLLFTSSARQSQTVQRYDVGDSGRWVLEPCACGLTSPRFELLQRHGKLIRIGTDFISLAIVAEHLQTPFQLVLDHAPDGLDRMTVRCNLSPIETTARLQRYPTLVTIIDTGLLAVEVEVCDVDTFTRNQHSGKTPVVIDERLTTQHDQLQEAKP